MLDFLALVFDTSDFSPRWYCGHWTTGQGWLHILSDLGVWSAYLAIPCVLVFFAARRRDIPFRRVFWLFGAFILACGTTHLMEAVIFWWPAYRLAGLIKLCTGVVSWATVFALVRVAPEAMAMRSPADLEREIAERTAELARANAALQTEVAERKRAEQALTQADRRKDEFLAMLAHELRNPLAPVSNAVQVLGSPGVAPDRAERARGIIERQVRHLVRMVDDLLDVSRLVRGRVELRREKVALADIVARAIETAQPAITFYKQSLSVNLPADPVYLDADIVRMAQVLGNLLNNAAKYTDPGGRVGITADVRGDRAVIRVTDTGCGIAPDNLPFVFDLFMQVDRTYSRSHGGLGIGLTVVKSLVESHGGSVSAASDGVGTGSTFTVTLPLYREAESRRTELLEKSLQ